MSREARPTNAVGVIDIGSNSVRLMVVRAGLKRTDIIFTDIITSRLLSGVKNGVLDDMSIERTVSAIRTLISEARVNGATDIIAFGTCAMREGVNSGRIVEEIKKTYNVNIEILSGADEAQLAYMGVSKSGRNGIIDIGGGSTELTVGEDKRVLRCASAPVGAVRLHEAPIPADPEILLASAREALSPAWETVKDSPCASWTGVGGTITTIAAMSLELKVYDPNLISRFSLTRDRAREWFYRLYHMTVAERRMLPGIKQNRADIIPFGAAILVSFFDLSEAKSISVNDNDNMMGYLRFKRYYG